MSKSIGNVLLIRDLLNDHPGEVLRLALLSAHYRQPLDWSDQLVVDSRRRLDRMYTALRDAGIEGPGEAPAEGELPPDVLAALEDDLNTPEALAALAGRVRATNASVDPAERRALAESLRASGWLLGLLQQDPALWFANATVAGDGPSADAIEAKLRERTRLRKDKAFQAADAIRDELAGQGIQIEDVAGETRWRRS
jgi:cysteinyl-tRNA synthetase